MGFELVELDEGAGIEEEIEPLPGRGLALGVLFGDPFVSAAELGLPLELGDLGAELVVILVWMVGHGVLFRLPNISLGAPQSQSGRLLTVEQFLPFSMQESPAARERPPLQIGFEGPPAIGNADDFRGLPFFEGRLVG
jgi:hypothetical protein